MASKRAAYQIEDELDLVRTGKGPGYKTATADLIAREERLLKEERFEPLIRDEIRAMIDAVAAKGMPMTEFAWRLHVRGVSLRLRTDEGIVAGISYGLHRADGVVGMAGSSIGAHYTWSGLQRHKGLDFAAARDTVEILTRPAAHAMEIRALLDSRAATKETVQPVRVAEPEVSPPVSTPPAVAEVAKSMDELEQMCVRLRRANKLVAERGRLDAPEKVESLLRFAVESSRKALRDSIAQLGLGKLSLDQIAAFEGPIAPSNEKLRCLLGASAEAERGASGVFGRVTQLGGAIRDRVTGGNESREAFAVAIEPAVRAIQQHRSGVDGLRAAAAEKIGAYKALDAEIDTLNAAGRAGPSRVKVAKAIIDELAADGSRDLRGRLARLAGTHPTAHAFISHAVRAGTLRLPDGDSLRV